MLAEKVKQIKASTPVDSDPDAELVDLSYGSNYTVIVEESCSLYEETFLDMLPEIIKTCAALTNQKFEAIAWYNSCNCGYSATIEAERVGNTLNMRTVVSMNGDGICPECCVQVVCYDEYDPNETYYCPECGEELDHEEMFGGDLPVITKETIEIE